MTELELEPSPLLAEAAPAAGRLPVAPPPSPPPPSLASPAPFTPAAGATPPPSPEYDAALMASVPVTPPAGGGRPSGLASPAPFTPAAGLPPRPEYDAASMASVPLSPPAGRGRPSGLASPAPFTPAAGPVWATPPPSPDGAAVVVLRASGAADWRRSPSSCHKRQRRAAGVGRTTAGFTWTSREGARGQVHRTGERVRQQQESEHAEAATASGLADSQAAE